MTSDSFARALEAQPAAGRNGEVAESDHTAYLSFWDTVGESFPSLKGAASTRYYFECERSLFEEFFPPLAERSIFKTDLWDEAKNTEILRWAAEQGARPYGVDIAGDVVHQARKVLGGHRPGFAVSDIRALPFPANSFDLIYSMGTIEHFPDYRTAVDEIYRVLKPGGTAIIGVPNKADPFLRPLMVHFMNLFGWYGYGMEKSFTHGQLRRLLESSGFRATGAGGILFIPGWLRMADLLCHTRLKFAAPLTGWLVRPFSWLYKNVPAVRRHGYMIACVAVKPTDPSK
jgi:SAM-dependent methyltransferase